MANFQWRTVSFRKCSLIRQPDDDKVKSDLQRALPTHPQKMTEGINQQNN